MRQRLLRSSFLLVLSVAPAIGSEPVNRVINFNPKRQENENACWAAVTQMLLEFQKDQVVSQCEIASKVKGRNCCVENKEVVDDCYKGVSLDDALALFKVVVKPLQQNENRWPVDPRAIIDEVKKNRLVVLRWARGKGKANHVSIVSGQGTDDGEEFIRFSDSAIGELDAGEDRWTQFFPHLKGVEDLDSVPTPFVYRAWTVEREVAVSKAELAEL